MKHLPGASSEDQILAIDVMVRHPKTLPASATVQEARDALADDHVHMVLLTDGGQLVGTVMPSDLPEEEVRGQAMSWATLAGRTVAPEEEVLVVQRMLVERGLRRVAVVDDSGALRGLMCLKRHRRGFCSDADVTSRADERAPRAVSVP